MPTFDSKGTATVVNTGGSQTVANPTIGVNNNRILLVMLWSTGGAFNPSSVTFNGVSLTSVASGNTGITNDPWFIYYLLAPATGSHALAFSGTNGTGSGILWASYYNVSQSNQFDATAQSAGTTTDPLSQSLSSVADSSLIASFGISGGVAGSALSGTGAVNNNQSSNAAGNGATILSGYFGDSGPISPSASKTATLTTGDASNRLIYMVSIKAITQTSAVSASVMNGASRLSTVTKSQVLGRAVAASVMNAASRLASIARSKINSRTLSDAVMNGASRFATVISSGGIWRRQNKSSSSFTNTPKSSS